ncbi:hypothetical protein [Marinomonas sp. 2405UD68-3]|uniref:hypothetical protein n=1 Tax=Marinomonas sp. 2405UD68-3 TaxID=3391835 RepID=UPI0039C90F7E
MTDKKKSFSSVVSDEWNETIGKDKRWWRYALFPFFRLLIDFRKLYSEYKWVVGQIYLLCVMTKKSLRKIKKNNNEELTEIRKTSLTKPTNIYYLVLLNGTPILILSTIIFFGNLPIITKIVFVLMALMLFAISYKLITRKN